MKNRVISIIASFLCSILWVAIPFIEEYFAPSGANDSWQRGLVITPFVIIPAMYIIHFICKKTIAVGCVSFLPFVVRSSFYGVLLLLSIGFPLFIVSLIFGLTTIANLLVISGYLLIVVYLTFLPPISLWWLIVLNAHNQSSNKDTVI